MIYFVLAATTDLIKVGVTSQSVQSRISALQTACPFDLVLLGTVDGGEVQEAAIHRCWAEHHERGEWFRATDETLRAIAARTTLKRYDAADFDQNTRTILGKIRVLEIIESLGPTAAGALADAFENGNVAPPAWFGA